MREAENRPKAILNHPEDAEKQGIGVIDGRLVRAAAGTVLAAPRGAIHAFPVAIGRRARFLNLHTPGGFERYIRELTAMRSRGETPTDEFFRSHDQYNV